MRIALLILGVVLCAAWGRVDDEFAFDANSENAVVLYESAPNVDLIILPVNLEQGRPIGSSITLPAAQRFSADRVSHDDYSMGFKELTPGFYAIIDAHTNARMASGANALCRDQSAIVFEVGRGEVRVLPRSLYQIRDGRDRGRTGRGEELLDLVAARHILAGYPGIQVEAQLVEPRARIRFAARTTEEIVRGACATSDTFEILPDPPPPPPRAPLPSKTGTDP